MIVRTVTKALLARIVSLTFEMCFLRSTLLKPSAVQAQLSLKKVPDGFLRPGRLQIIHLSWVRAIPMVSIVMLLRFYSAMRESSLVWTLMMLLWWSFPIFSPLEMNTPFFDLERHSVVGQLSIFRSFIDHMLDLPRFSVSAPAYGWDVSSLWKCGPLRSLEHWFPPHSWSFVIYYEGI